MSSSSLLGRLSRRKIQESGGKHQWSGHGVRIEWLEDLFGKIRRGELAKDVQIAVANEDRPTKKMFELGFMKGEILKVTDTKSYPNWKAAKKNGKKGSVPAKMMRVKTREEWTWQDVIDTVLPELAQPQNQCASIVDLVEERWKSPQEFVDVAAVVVGRDCALKDLVLALKDFCQSESSYIWIDAIACKNGLGSGGESCRYWFAKEVPEAIESQFSQTVVVFDHYGSIPSCLSVSGLWWMYFGQKNLRICMAPEKRSDFMSCLGSLFDQIETWVSDVRIERGDRNWASTCSKLESSSSDIELNEEVETEILSLAKAMGLQNVNKTLQTIIGSWFAERCRAAFERMSIKVLPSLEEGKATPSPGLAQSASATALFGVKVANFLLSGRLDDEGAKEILAKCVSLGKVGFGKSSFQTADILIKYSRACGLVVDTPNQINALEEAQEILEGLEPTEEEAMLNRLLLSTVYDELGKLYESSGGRKKALALYNDKLVPIKEFLFSPTHEEVLATIQRVVRLNLELKEAKNSLVQGTKLLDLCREIHGEKSTRTGIAMVLLGSALHLNQDNDEAISMLQKGAGLLRQYSDHMNDSDLNLALRELRVLQQQQQLESSV